MKRIKIKLSPEEDAILYYEKTMGRNKTIRQRAAILYEAGQGAESMMEISRKLCCSQQNVRHVLERFEEKRMESLYACARGKRPNQLDAREQEITEELNRHPARSVPEVVAMLKEKFGICITETPVRIWLRRKGYQYRKTKAIPAKANKKKQKHFVNCCLSDLLKDAEKGIKKVYFADGVHLIYGYEKGYCWSQKPVCIPSGYGRKRVNVLGFLDAVTHQVLKVMGKTENYLNADSVCRGLKMIREQNPEEKQIYIILDNASYHHCEKVKETAKRYGIMLVFLPPYSPNLNLIERFWKFLRKNLLSIRYYSSFDEFFDAIFDFIDDAHIRFKERLHSLLSFNFQFLDISYCSNRG